jgi:UDP-2,3-diacylglucosamine pyrophosphatase LpxH/gas vesicle protein
MTEHPLPASDIEPGDASSIAVRLEETDAESAFQTFERLHHERPESRATFIEALCRTSSAALAVRDLLRDGCHHADEGVRRDLVSSFQTAHRQRDLFLGASLLTRDDGTRVFIDYFENDGELFDVLDWVSELGVGYRRALRTGAIKPEYDGLFTDTWNDVKEVGKDIGQTIKDAVDDVENALQSAGQGLQEFVNDLAEFAQQRISAVFETVFQQVQDVGAQVKRFLKAASQQGFSAIEKIVKGLRTALQSRLSDLQAAVDMVIAKAKEVGSNMLRQATRVLRNAGESLKDLVKAVGKLTKEAAATVVQTLVDMVEYAERRAKELIRDFREAFQDARELIEYIIQKFGDLVDRWAQRAKNELQDIGQGVKALIIRAAREGRQAAKSVFRTLLGSSLFDKSVGWILEVIDENVPSFFRNAVDLLNRMVPEDRFYPSVFGFNLLGAVFIALEQLNEPLTGIVKWAADKGEAAVRALHAVFSKISKLPRNALFHFAKAVAKANLAVQSLLRRAIEWGQNHAYVAFYGVLAFAVNEVDTIENIFSVLWNNARDLLGRGFRAIRRIEWININDLLTAAWRIAGDLLTELVEHLNAVGRAYWYLLDWVIDTVSHQDTKAALAAVFRGLLNAMTEVGTLVIWCAGRTARIMRLGFAVLRGLDVAVRTILVTLLTNPSVVFHTAVRELNNVVGDLEVLFDAVVSAPEDILGRLYRALDRINVGLKTMLDAVSGWAKSRFVDLAERFIELGVEVFEMILWAINERFKLFGWVIDAVEAVIDSWIALLEDVVEFVDPLETFAEMFAQWAANAFETLRDDIVAPVLAAGKFHLLVSLAVVAWPFLVIAYLALGALVNVDETPYRDWPDDFRAFECQVRANAKEVRPPDEDHGIVVVSDLHMEDQDDITAGLGHFDKNASLMTEVLDYYASTDDDDFAWTVVVNGDSEEFWKDNDLTTNEPAAKVDSIAATHPSVHNRLSEEFYKYDFPRRLIKLVGNHDAAYDDPHVVNAYRDNGFPDIEVYEYVTTQFNGDDLLILHGHQFDPYNCDANNDFGKFASNFGSEPIDTWSNTLTDLFGEGARIEGEQIVLSFLPDPIEIPLPFHFFAPYYEPEDWRPLVESTDDPSLVNPAIEEWLMFDEHNVADQINAMATSMIIGHTHAPKLMKSSQHPGVFYVNSGTSGWWEGSVWTVEVTKQNVRLIGWTEGDDGSAERTYAMTLNEPKEGEPVDLTNEHHHTLVNYDDEDVSF